jgi:hypothetical protein
MVEISDISFVLAGPSVSVAAFYYIFNMRHAMKSREMETIRFLTQFMTSEERMQSLGSILHSQIEWKDWKDFHQNFWNSNLEMFASINSIFWLGEMLGYIIRNKLAKAETIFDLGGFGLLQLWNRFSGYIYWRREEMTSGAAIAGRSWFKNFEFLAQEMKKISDSRKQAQEQMNPILQ